MEQLYVFLIRNNEWIYIVCGMGIFWFLTELWRANRLLRRAMFGLERERGAQQRNTAVGFLLLFCLIAGAVFYVNRSIAPTLPPALLFPPTPTPDIFRTPLAPPTPLATAVTTTPAPELAPTVTLPIPSEGTALPERTPLPTLAGPTPTPFVGCNILLNITEPRDGATIPPNVSFFGTVETADFNYYRLEANGPETNGQWASLLGRPVNQTVRDGFLGSVNLSQWEPGPYLIRLTAVNLFDAVTGYCVIQVTLTG